MAETGIHVMVMVTLIATLRLWFRARDDVYVIGNVFLYYQEGHPKARRSPDVMVVKGIDATRERRSFKTWEEKAVPCVVFEITSDETAREDQQAKRQLYESLGVKEYFLFDPLHDYLPHPLVGYRLVKGRYQSMTAGPEGALDSAELGLRLMPEGTQLALFDSSTGQRVPTLSETHERWQQSMRELEQSRKQQASAERRAARAARKAEQEKQRIAALEAELARLRALLPPESSGDDKHPKAP